MGGQLKIKGKGKFTYSALKAKFGGKNKKVKKSTTTDKAYYVPLGDSAHRGYDDNYIGYDTQSQSSYAPFYQHHSVGYGSYGQPAYDALPMVAIVILVFSIFCMCATAITAVTGGVCYWFGKNGSQ